VIPYLVSLQSQDGDLGVIYEGSSLWNLLPPEDDGSPYIQDFDLKERLFEITVDVPYVIEIGPIIDPEGDEVFVEMLSPEDKQFEPWITNNWLGLND